MGVAATSLYAGRLVALNEDGLSMLLFALLGLAGVVVLASVPVPVLFLGWLFLAPLFQASADVTSLGRTLTWGLYIAPALLLIVLTVLRREHGVAASPVDWLPGAYVAYVIASIGLTTDTLQSDPTGSAKAILTVVALGPIAYYFLVFGPGARIGTRPILATVMTAGLLQGLFAMLEYATGWNLWNFTGWQRAAGGGRVVATLANPGVLGAFLGVAIVVAVTALIWRGPRRIRTLAWVTIAVCTPGLLATLTRGPILATAAVVVALLVLGRARVLGLGVLAVSALAIVFLLPSLQNTETYKERVAQKATVELRVAIQDVSLQLAAEKPVFGWGYGSFDRVKQASQITIEGIPIRSVLEATSHDSYLTKLVELGSLGFGLFMAPFAVLGYRALRRPSPPLDRWLVVAAVASLVVMGVTAGTLDFRFFSFAQMLPFVFLAILRRESSTPKTTDA
jgi:O-antigen ligase